MEDQRKFALDDEALDNVAGGRDANMVGLRYCVRNPNYACSSCGGHEFFVVDGDGRYYNGECMNCGTYNSRVGLVGGLDAFTV